LLLHLLEVNVLYLEKNEGMVDSFLQDKKMVMIEIGLRIIGGDIGFLGVRMKVELLLSLVLIKYCL
jgi:hypothetical protein